MADLGNRTNVDAAIDLLLDDLAPDESIQPSDHNGLLKDILDTLANGLSNTLRTANTTSGQNIEVTAGDSVDFENASFLGSLVPDTLTANRQYTLPDQTGVVALLSDIPSGGNILDTNGLTLLGNYSHDMSSNTLTFDGNNAISNDIFVIQGQTGTFQTYASFSNTAGVEISSTDTNGALAVRDQLFGLGVQFKVNRDTGGFWRGPLTLGASSTGVAGFKIPLQHDFEFYNSGNVRDIFFDLALGTKQIWLLEQGYVRASGSLVIGGNAPISTEDITLKGDVMVCDSSGDLGFYGTAPVAQQTITGSRGGNAALADLLTKLANTGLIIDNTTA